MRISKLIQDISSSKTMELESEVRNLQLEGRKVISLVAGAPGFKTPEIICKSAVNAIEDGFTNYTPVDGITELKKGVVNRYFRDFDLKFSLDEVIISSGAKHCVYNALMCLIDPGDEVIFGAPYWVSYPEIIKLCKGMPVIIKASYTNELKLTALDLRKCITHKTKAFILCNPSNPTGLVYSEQDLSSIAEVMRDFPDLFMICDDIYDMLCWDGLPDHFLNIAPDLKNRVIVINGVSKGYSMAGWRIGYTLAPKDIILGIKKFQSQSLSNPCSISQKASTTALDLTYSDLSFYISTYKEQVLYMYEALLRIEGVKCLKPTSSYYLFPNIEKLLLILGFKSEKDFCKILLQEVLVGVMPGESFGCPGYIRISCSVGISTLNEAIKRINDFIDARITTK